MYEALDSRVKKVYPNLVSEDNLAEGENVEAKEERPAVQSRIYHYKWSATNTRQIERSEVYKVEVSALES